MTIANRCWRRISSATGLAILALTLIAVERAEAEDDHIPFPELQTETYCRELVAKMLDPAEQKQEYLKCMGEELLRSISARPYWDLLSGKKQRWLVERHYKEPRHQTYGTLQKYLEVEIGHACMARELDCQKK